MNCQTAAPLHALPPRIIALLSSLGQFAAEMGMEIWCVGGTVRDVMLGINHIDIDVVVEGDGIAFAGEFALRFGADLRTYERFGTAHLVCADGLPIDVATARTEIYEKPGALPRIRPGSISDDLGRRDFTINAMAASLGPLRFGKLSDCFGGLEDLENRVIRVLHSNSFIDDPTRIFRALRFQERLGFGLDRQTGDLLKKALDGNCLKTVQAYRIATELKLVLQEKNNLSLLGRLENLGILPRLRTKRQADIKKILYEIDRLMAIS